MRMLELELGRYDDPENRTQKNYCIDLFRSNLAVFGNAMSGKTTLIKTLLFRLHQKSGLTDKEEIYILDFGHSLKEYAELPYVVGYFDAAHEENVRRVFRILDEKLKKNIKALGGQSYVDVPEDKRPNHVTFVLDGFSSFYSEDRYAGYVDDLKKLAREGLSRGISVVIVAAETNGFGRLSASFNRIIAFDLPQDQYSEVYGRKVEKPIILQGRGLANAETNVYEFQAYLPWDISIHDMKDAQMIRETDCRISFYGLKYDPSLLRQQCEKEELLKQILEDSENVMRIKQREKVHKAYMDRKLKMLPENLTVEEWGQYSDLPFQTSNGDFIAGLDYYTLEPVPAALPAALNLREAQTIAIYGRKEFGKSNLLKLLLEAAERIPNTHFCFWDDGRQALTKPEGLQEIINRLESKVFINTREEFMACLEQCGFPVFRRPEAAEVSPRNANLASANTEEQILEEQNKLRDRLDEWDMEWDQKFRLQRDRMQDEGTWTNEFGQQQREQHERDREQMEEALRQKMDQLRNELSHTSDTAVEYCSEFSKNDHDLTVFVIQSRLFYQNPPQGEAYHMIPHMMSALGTGHAPVLFIFSDVQRIESRDVQTYFNNSVRHAFLLDDIVRFVTNKGQYSVFGNQDVSELKERFGPCELGDGFYFDIDRDDLTKLKFVRSYPEGSRKEGK